MKTVTARLSVRADQPPVAIEMPTLHAAVERQAVLRPHATAVVEPGRSLTYRALNDRADRIAGALVARGVRPGEPVVIAVPRSADTIAAFLGTLKAGAVYCPLDLEDPPARRAVMVRDAGPRAILTTHQQQPAFAEWPDLCLPLEDLPASTGETVPSAPLTPGSPAALMYTSGSTGRPKGARITHGGMLRLFLGSDFVTYGPDLRSLFHSPPHFDGSTFEIYAPLVHGGACVVFPDERVPSLQAFGDVIRSAGVNCLFVGPAYFNLIVDEDPQILAGVRDLVVGGDALSVRHARTAKRLFPAIRLVNGYGPTETTTFATTYEVPADLPADARSVPIGKPIAGTACHVLDDRRSPAADGAVGELYIGGRGVALGYVDRPGLTAERFLPDPFDPDPDARMYRTGDLCRRLPDGNLEFLGRADQQVKIRGYRVEPGEVEAELQRHPDVARAAVVVGTRAGQPVLTAYYMLHPGTRTTSVQILDHLRRQLPAYMLPQSVVPIPNLPLTPSGTIDRAALLGADAAASEGIVEATTSSGDHDPATLEQQILVCWRQVLNVERLGVDDDCFDLGATSLDAVRLCLRIEQATGRFVPISTLMDHRTARTLARAMSGAERPLPSNAVLLAKGGGRSPVFFVGADVGHALELRALAATAVLNRPVYGLQMPGMDGASAPAQSAAEAVAHLLPTVRDLSAGRTVHLLGFCLGGQVAYELACQLTGEGARVGKVILVDAVTNASLVRKSVLRRVVVCYRYLVRFGPRHVMRRVGERFLGRPAFPPARPGDSLDYRILRMRHAHRNASRKYVPGQYAGDLVCIRSSDDFRIDPSVSPGCGGWDAVAQGNVKTVHAPGDHETMLRPPNVAATARLVEQELASAD